MIVADTRQDEKEIVFIEIVSDLTKMKHDELVKLKDITQGVMLAKEAEAMRKENKGA